MLQRHRARVLCGCAVIWGDSDFGCLGLGEDEHNK
jgi:hypothetical protein